METTIIGRRILVSISFMAGMPQSQRSRRPSNADQDWWPIYRHENPILSLAILLHGAPNRL